MDLQGRKRWPRQFLSGSHIQIMIDHVAGRASDMSIPVKAQGSTSRSAILGKATFTLSRRSGVPLLRSGFVLAFPTLDIEIARQCSGIRSALILMISSMALAHLSLRSYWGKILLILAAVPISMAKNGVRIFALSMLGMKVNPAFLYGRLHRNGGIVFFLLAMAGLPPSSKPYAR